MKNLIDVHSTLIELERQVKRQVDEVSAIRGNAREDFMPDI